MAISLIPLFHKICSKNKTNNINTNNNISKAPTTTTVNSRGRSKFSFSKSNLLHFLILILIFGLFVVISIFVAVQTNIYIQKNKAGINSHNYGLSSKEGLEMIFLCVISIFLLKYKYYRHHIISIILFIIICIIMDLVTDNFSEFFDIGALFIILNIILTLLDALDYEYQKYMLEILFHSYWGISMALGLTNLFIVTIVISLCLIKGKEDSFKEKNIIFMGFYSYFDTVGVGMIITKQLLNFILNFALNLVRVFTILNFSPDYVLVSFTISRVFYNLVEKRNFFCIVLFIIQFLILMFYLEIIELNFLGLNTNTKRNIIIREQSENLLGGRDSVNSINSDIEIIPGYTVNNNSINNNDILIPVSENINSGIELKENF